MVRRLLLGVSASLVALIGSVGAAGYSIYEQGAAATAQAGAVTARASDPSAVFYNPAGIARQSAALNVGTTLIFTATDFEGGAPTLGIPDAKHEMKSGLFYPSTVYAVAPVGRLGLPSFVENVSVGFGFFTPFGLGTEWKDTFSGKWISEFAEIQSFYFNPVLAVDMGVFTVGAGVQAVHANVNMKRDVRQAAFWPADLANLELEGNNSINWGFNVGFQVLPTEWLIIGASYRSEVNAALEGTAKFKNPAPGTPFPAEADVESEIPCPEIIGVGIAVSPLPALSVEADVVMMRWSTFKTLPMTFLAPYDGLSDVIQQNYKDSRSYRIGAEYQLTDALALRAGYLYDESPQPEASVSPMLPDAARNSVQVGVGYKVGSVSIDAAYMWLKMVERTTSTNHNNFNGTYNSSASLVGISLGYAF
jgi:long-chain fatty acid transport protein